MPSNCMILHFCQQCVRVPISLPPHQPLLLSVFLMTAILVGLKWCLMVVLIWISLMSNEEHLFMCLLAICASSLKKYLFRSFAHFQLVFIEFWVLHIFLILDPHQIYDIQIFAPILWIVFSLSYSFLLECKAFNFYEVSFTPYSLVSGALSCIAFIIRK